MVASLAPGAVLSFPVFSMNAYLPRHSTHGIAWADVCMRMCLRVFATEQARSIIIVRANVSQTPSCCFRESSSCESLTQVPTLYLA